MIEHFAGLRRAPHQAERMRKPCANSISQLPIREIALVAPPLSNPPQGTFHPHYMRVTTARLVEHTPPQPQAIHLTGRVHVRHPSTREDFSHQTITKK